LREHLGQDVETGAFVGSHHDFTAGYALGFGDLVEDGFAAFQRFLGILEK